MPITDTSVVASQIVTDAFTEIRVARAGDVIAPERMAFGINKLNRLLDRWNANPRVPYAVGFPSFTPITNHQPHTLGPSTGSYNPPAADWAVAQAPIAIRGANLILNTSTPAVRVPINIRDAAWWRNQRLQGLATSIVTDLYYSRGAPNEAGWPNGSVYLWPVPTIAYPVELEMDGLLNLLALTDTFWLPYGYRDAITLTLAVECAPGLGQTASPDLKHSASEARGLIFGRNDKSANARTRDGGMPTGHTKRTRWSYLTGNTLD